MSTLRVLVADDELLARRRLQRLLGAFPDLELVGECARGDEVLARAAHADLVLLDVNMPGLSGLEALARWPASGAAVVLCTAHAEHGPRAYDGGVVDYLLKPVEPARLGLAIERVRERRAMTAPPPLALATAGGLALLRPADISHLVLDGELVSVHTRGERYLSAQPLGELHASLPTDSFVRVHRRAVVSLAHVERFVPLGTGGLTARMRGGQEVPVSRQAARWLRRRLQPR